LLLHFFMSSTSLSTRLNEITCFICQETLSDPVSILCGHSFCLKCLNDYWDQSHECSCPECRRTFTTRPELHRNTVLNELVKKIKKPRLSPHPSQNYAGPGDVECDTCTGMKFKAVKSCLTCMASYCPTHLQPHFEIAAWKGHKLTDPDGNLKVELCVKHQKRLEIFCKNEETCICMMCALTEHEGHKKYLMKKIKSEEELHLSEGNKKVTHAGTVTDYPDHPDRFDWSPQVLCREGLTGTRFYWEVECNGIWIDIGVAYKGLSRKGRDWGYGLRYNDKSWCLHYSQYYSPYHYSEYHNNKKMEINTPYSSRIGVYLDWPAGSLSFYSVSHTMTLLHRFSTTFTEPLYPGFSLNAGPLCVCSLGSK
uniref:Uncharacterized protein n=1 Tax=Erpetoichthys calabaricus TaxID=27687 RepID=A0A8C4T3Z7_ERPCA